MYVSRTEQPEMPGSADLCTGGHLSTPARQLTHAAIAGRGSAVQPTNRHHGQSRVADIAVVTTPVALANQDSLDRDSRERPRAPGRMNGTARMEPARTPENQVCNGCQAAQRAEMTTQARRHALSDPHDTPCAQRRFLTGKFWAQHCSPGWRDSSGMGRKPPGVIPDTASPLWLAIAQRRHDHARERGGDLTVETSCA